MDQQLTSAERRQQLARSYAAPTATVSAKMPEIRLSVHMSKKPIEKGHFFIVDRNVEEGEDPIITDIGEKFKCVVLRSCMKLSAFDSDNGTSLAESTEFNDFQNEQLVVIDNAGDRPVVATVAPYSAIKAMKYEPTKEELKLHRDTKGAEGRTTHPLYPVVKDLKLQYMAYVLYKAPGAEAPGVYLLRMGARGYLGMTPTGEACRYGEEAETSFVKARSICNKETPRATHMHWWSVFSSNFEAVENGAKFVDHYPSFKIEGQWGDDMLDIVEESQKLLKEWIMSQYGRRISFAWRNTSDREFIPRDVAAILDSATSGDEVAQLMLGNRAAAAKSQLTVGGSRPEATAALPSGVDRRSSKQRTEDVAADLGGEAPAPIEAEIVEKPAGKLDKVFPNRTAPAPADAKPIKAPRRTRQEEEAVIAAAGAKPIPGAAMQHDDPNAPGYVPKEWGDDSIAAGQAEQQQTSQAVSDIPPGW